MSCSPIPTPTTIAAFFGFHPAWVSGSRVAMPLGFAWTWPVNPPGWRIDWGNDGVTWIGFSTFLGTNRAASVNNAATYFRIYAVAGDNVTPITNQVIIYIP